MSSRGSWLETTTETATALVADMSADPWGRFSPSVYETGRLVALTPSLPEHERRVDFLLRQQRSDGRWGGPGDYDIVPTLSAVDALMREQRRPAAAPRVGDAAARGLHALTNRLRDNDSLPDTVAVELMVPGLVDDINDQLERVGSVPLPTPKGTYADLLAQLRSAVAHDYPLPDKLLHSLEIVGPPAQGAAFVTPAQGTVVGCSPAATAAWLGDRAVRDEHDPCVRYLRAVQDPTGGIPVAAPLALFERSWVLSTLAGIGVRFHAPPDLVASLHAAFTDEGAAGGWGLPPDADDTATALLALALLGSPRSPECLWTYDTGEHFACFPDERTPSTSTNAHVLQAIGASLTPELPDRDRYVAAAGRVTRWLAECQQSDGSWRDKWHASPYYATVCCATALAEHGGPEAEPAVRKAVAWLLATQREDGSWGHWDGTAEETAYAMRTLLHPAIRAGEHAAARGATYLRRPQAEHPALWHDKDLYTPLRIVETEILAALHLARTTPAVAALLEPERIGAG
ncbi:prenyltransferase/squalene oxidase repeat-containing protein [Prauserella cavernicola]|uniref:Prenyltransferase n=1 Tax=Prauserella cavernicola TaxID=2800127 RepID=A0A934V6S3_9PSEU|nr:prenyltransferase/squalene oxidase repeat-containing protein [Prauserella cavernicola]MBK1786984.1 prenyltransferase [Prauserella cavernicola]